MVFGRKKKNKAETKEELEARLEDLKKKASMEEDADEDYTDDREDDVDDEDEDDVLPEAPASMKDSQDKVKVVKAKKGKFNLSDTEMALAVNALADREEFILYKKMVVGQKIAEIIESYNTAVSGKHEQLPTE